MLRNRTPDASKRARPVSAQKIDTPMLVVGLLTAFFATLFATLLVRRPESSGPTEAMPEGSHSTQTAPPVNAPPVNTAPVSAPPAELVPRAEPKPEPMVDPTLRTQLEQLGVICAEGANCYPE